MSERSTISPESGVALLAAMTNQRVAITRAMEAIQGAMLAQEEALRDFITRQDEVNKERDANLRKFAKGMAKVVQQVQDLENKLSKLEANTAWMEQ